MPNERTKKDLPPKGLSKNGRRDAEIDDLLAVLHSHSCLLSKEYLPRRRYGNECEAA